MRRQRRLVTSRAFPPYSSLLRFPAMVQFFRSSPTDDRRRRVLTEEVISSPAAATARNTTKNRGAARTYAPGAQRNEQPSLVDFVPQRVTMLILSVLLGVSIAAGLEAIYATGVLTIDGARLPAFDLAADGNLANWFTSLLLLQAGVVAMVIYSVRRHRLDDYQGSYRVWLWAACGIVWLSIDEGASLNESVQLVCVHFASQTAKHVELAWLCVYAMVLGGIGIRLAFEMRACKFSTTTFVLSIIVGVTAVAARMGALPIPELELQVLVEEGCQMGAGLLLVLALCLHTRHVVQDAEGKAPAKAKKTEAATATRRGMFGRKTRIDPPETPTRASAKRSDLEPADSDDEDDDAQDEDDEDANSGPHDVTRLSKTERKNLRRQQRRARLG